MFNIIRKAKVKFIDGYDFIREANFLNIYIFKWKALWFFSFLAFIFYWFVIGINRYAEPTDFVFKEKEIQMNFIPFFQKNILFEDRKYYFNVANFKKIKDVSEDKKIATEIELNSGRTITVYFKNKFDKELVLEAIKDRQGRDIPNKIIEFTNKGE